MSKIALEWVGSGDSEALAMWDRFLLDSPRGHYSQFSTWLKSYAEYGLDFAVLVARREPSGPIIGGAGLLWLGNRFMRIMTLPIGPIVDTGQEDAASPILEGVLDRARTWGASVLQLRFPCSATRDLPALLSPTNLPELGDSRPGIAFKYAGAHTEMLWIDFPKSLDDASWRDQILGGFGKHHRMVIRQSERKGMEASEATTEAEMREAYSVIEENARLKGYAVRMWKDYGKTLIEQVGKAQAIMLVARYKGSAVGAHYGQLAGRRYTYALGGTTDAGRDLEAGYFLQWAAINRARNLGLLGYDLTSKSTPNVWRFKKGFNPEHIPLLEPRYVVFSKLRYKAFCLVYPTLRKNRDLASRISHLVRRVAS
jgi:hypothetical protein